MKRFRGRGEGEARGRVMTDEEAAKCRLRLWVFQEVRTWGKNSPLHKVFVRGVVHEWRKAYDGKPPRDVKKLRAFVDAYLQKMQQEKNIWRWAFVEGLTACVLEEMGQGVSEPEDLSCEEEHTMQLIEDYLRSLGPRNPLARAFAAGVLRGASQQQRRPAASTRRCARPAPAGRRAPRRSVSVSG